MAWLSGWDKRIEITISNTHVDSDLTHFPMLLELGTSVGTGSTDVSCVFDELTEYANRKKIAVTTSDGETQLYVEIEKWDDPNEKALLWVSKSDWVVASAATTKIYLYYDAGHAENTTYVGDVDSTPGHSVWNSDYKGVWHLSETSGDPLDSTSNGNDATTTSVTSLDVDGKIGSGADFDGNNDYIEIPDSASLDINGNFTIAVQLRRESDSGTYERLITKGNDDATGWDYFIQITNADVVQVGFRDVGETNYVLNGASTIPSDSSWTFIAGVFNGTEFAVYKNGAADGTGYSAADPSGKTPRTSERNLEIGRLGINELWFYDFDGKMDEIRISGSVRSAAWIEANYYAQDDNIASWGSEKETMRIAGVRLSDAEKICGIPVASIEAIAGASNTS